ncbi:MAG TPA: hypothetical protein VIJ28_22930 [Chloroflexota bacterium]|jgi:hypothetical protein
MTTSVDPPFHWRSLAEFDLRVEHPLLRQPISLIVDDPTPGYNPAYFHSGFRNGPMHTSRELVDRFADLVEATRIRGKFSVIPYPFGLGRVDRTVRGVSHADVAYFLDVTRERIAPWLDITPEALTHWNALDLATGQLLPFWEHVWSRDQDRKTLLPYLSLGLEILDQVDLPCAGVTSPWDFGNQGENEYAEAILGAQQAVHMRSLSWYFLQADSQSAHVPPRLTIHRPEAGEAVVSIVACDRYDFGMGLWSGQAADPDMLIDAEGQGGRLAEVLRAGGPAVFHTHWQTMFAQGTLSGLPALAEVIRRIEEYFGDRVAWTGCNDLAHYAAAAASLTAEADDGTIALRLASPFACPRFTVSLGARDPREVRLDGVPLARAQTAEALREGSWFHQGGRIYLCWALAGDHDLRVS